MAKDYIEAGHIPVRLAEKFVPILKDFRYFGEAETLQKKIADEKEQEGHRRWSSTTSGTVWVSLPSEAPADLCRELAEVLAGERTKEVRSMYMNLRRVADILEDTDPAVPCLDKLPMAITTFLNKVCNRRGWLYRIKQSEDADEVVAYLPIHVEYHSGVRADASPWVEMKCVYNSHKGGDSDRPAYCQQQTVFSWHGGEVIHKRVSEVLRLKGLYAEHPTMEADYDATLEKYKACRGQYNEQFRVVGRIKNVTHRWYETDRQVTESKPGFVVNDESLVDHRPADFYHSNIYGDRKGHKKDSGVMAVPWHPFMFGFDMSQHASVWVHTDYCEPYTYLDIADKLVLPPEHAELVDAVVHDLGFVGKSDIVADKSAGTPVLCIGKPGIGKTLLAEVVSHRLKRPLYKINAGYLLGDENNRVKRVEDNLEIMLTRAERQKLIPLIDEGDVMIATRRADNLTQAAVVAAFLKTLEYFNGLLFLTSNRADIDDAVISRMAAVIVFKNPDHAARLAIWRIQNEAQGAKLSDALMKQLAAYECSGRDINRLLSLALRYERAGKGKADLHMFQRIAMFRGINMEDGAEPAPAKKGRKA